MKKQILAGCVGLMMMAPLAHSAVISLGDDTTSQQAIGFSFDFFGSTYTDVFVNSNGSLSFGSGETDFTETVAEFLADAPSIRVWDDFNPATGGSVFSTLTGNSFTVTWSGVPQFGNNDSNTFSISIFNDNAIEIALTSLNASDMLVGITGGNGAVDPGQSDFSALTGPFANNQTMYELFNSGFDLNGTTLRFETPVREPQTPQVPAPAALGLLGLGLLALGARKTKI